MKEFYKKINKLIIIIIMIIFDLKTKQEEEMNYMKDLKR